MITRLLRYLRTHHLALLALFVALGGSAYAAARIGSADIRDGAVRSADLRDRDVRARDLADSAVRPRNLTDAAAGQGTASGTIIDDNGSPLLLNPDGFTAVAQSGTGAYTLTLEVGAPGCNFATVFAGGDGAVATASVDEQEGQDIVVRLSDSEGEFADLGSEALGYEGFSIVATC